MEPPGTVELKISAGLRFVISGLRCSRRSAGNFDSDALSASRVFAARYGYRASAGHLMGADLLSVYYLQLFLVEEK